MASATHIHARCPNPNCRREYRVKAEFIGKTATCKGCGTKFVLVVENDTARSGGKGRSSADSPISSASAPALAVPTCVLKGFSQVGLRNAVEMPLFLRPTYADVLRVSEEIANAVSSEPMDEAQRKQYRDSVCASFGTVEYKHVRTSILLLLLPSVVRCLPLSWVKCFSFRRWWGCSAIHGMNSERDMCSP